MTSRQITYLACAIGCR